MAGIKGQRSAKPRKPTGLKIIEGTFQKALVKAEVRAPASTPGKPDFLYQYAVEKWDEKCKQLDNLGILSELDGEALAIFCMAWARWRDAEECLAEFRKADPRFRGLVIRTAPGRDGKGGGNTIQNPLVGIANKAMTDMLRAAIEFGMTPSARSRISTEVFGGPSKRKQDPADKYFA